jgi:hypothetical protein
MKVVSIAQAKWPECLEDARKEGIVLTKNGKPVVYMVGVEGMDLEQVEFGQSDELWKLIQARRKQEPISRAEFEKRVRQKRKAKKQKAAV